MKTEDMTRGQLLEIVRRLPVTADGVPIIYGMEVWYWDEEEEPPRDATWDSRGDFVKTTINGVFAKNFKEYAGEVTVSVAADSWEGGNGDVYSTREAALSATRQAGTRDTENTGDTEKEKDNATK